MNRSPKGEYPLLFRALAAARQHLDLFHASLAIFANAYASVDVCSDAFQPRSVQKHEGGVWVRDSEVIPFISPLWGRIDAAAVREPRRSADTRAVVEACTDLLTEIDWTRPIDDIKNSLVHLMVERTGITSKCFDSKMQQFAANPFGEPLRLLFDLLP